MISPSRRILQKPCVGTGSFMRQKVCSGGYNTNVGKADSPQTSEQ
jgi:hypothetical protein